MKVFNKQKEPKSGSSIPRISKLTDQDLMSWFDAAIMGLGASFDSWRYHDGPIDEVKSVVDSIKEMWAEIEAREDGRNSP